MWNKKEKITELPLGIEYSKDRKELDLTFTNVDIIPRGLKGVDSVKMLKVPNYIAPDFYGDIYVSDGSGSFKKVVPIEIYKAKFTYTQNPAFAESLRYGDTSFIELAVLPANMRFYERDEKVFLDLSKTTISERPQILGVDEILMPRKLFRCYHKPQMVHSKPRIKE